MYYQPRGGMPMGQGMPMDPGGLAPPSNRPAPMPGRPERPPVPGRPPTGPQQFSQTPSVENPVNPWDNMGNDRRDLYEAWKAKLPKDPWTGEPVGGSDEESYWQYLQNYGKPGGNIWDTKPGGNRPGIQGGFQQPPMDTYQKRSAYQGPEGVGGNAKRIQQPSPWGGGNVAYSQPQPNPWARRFEFAK